MRKSQGMLALMLGTGCASATADAPRLVALHITPELVAMAPGATQAFTVSGDWTGGEGTLAVTFSATGGTVNAAGLYAAGATPGSYVVIARHAASGLEDTAAVTINGSAPVGAHCDDAPASWLFCDDFEVDRTSAYFETPTGGGAFARVAGVGRDGSAGMRTRFAAGQVEAGGLHLAFGLTPQSYMRPAFTPTVAYRDIYWRFYLRLAPGWIGGGGDKLTRAMAFASTSTFAQAMVAHGWSGNAASADRDYLLIEPVSGTNTAGDLVTTTYNDFANFRWLGSARSNTAMFTGASIGQWQCLEFRVRLNDAGQSNGVFTFWRNGVEEATRTGLNWLGGFTPYGINAIYLENYWNAGAPQQQERYFDDFVVSGSRIGC